MKTTFLTTILFLFSIWVALGQNDADWMEKNYEVGNFSEVYLEGGYRIHLAQGTKNSLLVKASDSDVFDYLQVKEWGSELRIDIEEGEFELDRIALYITFRDLSKLRIDGGAKLYTKGYLDLKDFELFVSGGAKINMEMKAEAVKITGEGGVLLNLEGIAQSLDVKLSGAGHLNADELKVKDASVKIEGVGTGSVYATETLDARIEGVGKITYAGNPKVNRNVEGLGSVVKK